MRRATIAIVLGLALAGGVLWLRHPAHPAPVNASVYEIDVVEAVVRGVLRELPPPIPSICFLAFGEGTTPPSGAFVARFAGSQPAVRGCNSAVSPPIGKYFETSTGQPGLIVHIVKLIAPGPSQCGVVVAFSNLPPRHNHFIYRMRCDAGGEWIIQSRKPY